MSNENTNKAAATEGCAAVTGSEFVDTEHRDWPMCPKCGHEHINAWEWDLSGGFLEGDGHVECGGCGREFQVIRHVTVSYSTRDIQNAPVETRVLQDSNPTKDHV